VGEKTMKPKFDKNKKSLNIAIDGFKYRLQLSGEHRGWLYKTDKQFEPHRKINGSEILELMTNISNHQLFLTTLLEDTQSA
jgi:hypothetical protein